MDAKLDLKQLLIDLEGVDFSSLDEAELTALIYEMLENLGSTDSELRDGLIYPTMMRAIEEDTIAAEQMLHMLDTCLDERHLFFKLGESGSDSVFMRSFTSLVIVGLLNSNAKNKFIEDAVYFTAMDKIILYINLEKDTRGYVEDKGWAHAVAHGADMLLSLVKNPTFSSSHFLRVLDSILGCVFKEAAYIDGEDERLINVIMAMIDLGLSDAQLEDFVAKVFAKLESIYEADGFTYAFYRNLINATNFMKTFYFKLKSDNVGIGLRVHIYAKIREMQSYSWI